MKKYLKTLAARSAKGAKIAGQPWQNFWNEYLTRTAQAKACEDELKPLWIELKKVFGTLIMQNAVYFKLSNGEELIEDSEADEIETLMNAAYAEGKVLCRDKTTVINNVGRVFWTKTDKWAKTEIKKLGEVAPIGGIEMQNLNEAQISEIKNQIESARIAGLTSQAKSEEKAAVIKSLSGKAIAMRSELEIKRDPAALQKSQDWLDDAVHDAEATYA